MNKKIVHKVPQGKMLRIEADIDGSIIKEIKITGDFFIHPEEAIIEIEDFLTGKSLSDIGQALAGFLDEKSIRIIGFNPSDLELALAGQEPD
jgi:lipoate-protein ligase A